MRMKVSRTETEIVALISHEGGLYLRDGDSTTGFCCYISPKGVVSPVHTELKLADPDLKLTPVYRGDKITLIFT